MKSHLVSTILNLCLIILFEKSLCSYPLYDACGPKDCGDGLGVTYPFFIHGLHDPSCGYPGFDLGCSNGSSVIRISGNDYLVNHIDYGKSSMRLVNIQDITCPTKVTNLTLDHNRFTIDNSSTTEVVYLRNCTRMLPGNLSRYRIGSCNELVMLRSDRNLRMGMGLCGNAVVVPVELQDDEGRNMVVDGGNYSGMMERGFTVRWMAADCGVCERSGGRCGFNMADFQFRCFCRDRPHRTSCLIGKLGFIVFFMVFCECGKEAIVLTSWTSRNPGRRFYACPDQGSNCRWLGWVDAYSCGRCMEIIPGLLKSKNRVEEENTELKFKLKKVEEKAHMLKKMLIFTWISVMLYLVMF